MNVMHRIARFVFAAVFLVGAAAPAAAPVAAARLHPFLAQVAQRAPEQIVTVIVQKTDSSPAAEELVGRLGGQITQDLHIINAFGAYLTASAARELAASQTVRWVSPDGHMQSAANSGRKFTTWATRVNKNRPNGFANVDNALSPVGPDGVFASGANVVGGFRGFPPEYNPGQVIRKVEVALRLYTSARLGPQEKVLVTPVIAGVPGLPSVVNVSGCRGAQNACTLYVDITAARAVWGQVDLMSLEVVIDQSTLAPTSSVHHDAIGVRVSLDRGVDPTTPLVYTASSVTGPIATNSLKNVFNSAIRATEVWNEGPSYLQGQGVTVAVVDSGSFGNDGAGARLMGQVNFNTAEHSSTDAYGHGTFVASLVADGRRAVGGEY